MKNNINTQKLRLNKCNLQIRVLKKKYFSKVVATKKLKIKKSSWRKRGIAILRYVIVSFCCFMSTIFQCCFDLQPRLYIIIPI